MMTIQQILLWDLGTQRIHRLARRCIHRDPKGGPDNAVGGVLVLVTWALPPLGEGVVPAAKDDDPQDPPTAHPAGGKASSVEDLLKEASEIGAAIRGLIKEASDVPDARQRIL